MLTLKLYFAFVLLTFLAWLFCVASRIWRCLESKTHQINFSRFLTVNAPEHFAVLHYDGVCRKQENLRKSVYTHLQHVLGNKCKQRIQVNVSR